AGPAPAMTTTRTLSSAAIASSSACRAASSAPESALYWRPRFSVRVATPASSARRRGGSSERSFMAGPWRIPGRIMHRATPCPPGTRGLACVTNFHGAATREDGPRGAHSRLSMTGDTILETRGLTKEFKGFVAVDNVNLRVRRGAIHALIGPNGAGKTTFFNLLTKFLPPTAGTILFNGTDITRDRPADVARRGIIRSFQISAVFPNLTVLENVRVALQRPLRTSFQFWRSEKSLHALDGRAMALLERVGLAQFARLHAGELAYGRKRSLEIATTLAMEPELMLLDEP